MRMALNCLPPSYYLIVTDLGRYFADPSGTYSAYNAKAIGSGSEGAQTELKEKYHKSMTLAEAKSLAIKTLKQVMEEKLSGSNIQVATVTKEQGFKVMEEDEINSIVSAL